jgi:uncharacterized protein (DUF4415 family)
MKKPSKTKFEELEKAKDQNIDYSDIPRTDKGYWEDAQILYNTSKKPVSIRLDEDVIDWFKSFGKGYQTKINEVLKVYMQSIKKQEA